MKAKATIALGVAATLALLATGAARGAERFDYGKAEFEAKCVICHGPAGKGDGYYAPLIGPRMPDLSTLSRRNGGVLPVEWMYRVIDGREEVKAHGTRDMPIWGRHYANRARLGDGTPALEPEAFARRRILSLIEYIGRLQD